VSFLLVRVDDRLLHGQVVFAWGQVLAPHTYLIVDDQVATDPWERQAFSAAAPEGVTVAVLSQAEFAASFARIADRERTVVLLRGLSELAQLASAGFRPDQGVNLGGLHAGAGGWELLPYLHLTSQDRGTLRRLLAGGYPLFAQDLPGSPRHDASQLKKLIGLAADADL
jgi:mannose/fructose/N-acetylgalactosamine-specific phosphotransferase system component IIB